MRRFMNASLMGTALVSLWLISLQTAWADDKSVYERTLRSTGFVILPKVKDAIDIDDCRGTCWVVNREHKRAITNQHVVGESAEALVYFPAYKNGRVIHEESYYRQNIRAITGRV